LVEVVTGKNAAAGPEQTMEELRSFESVYYGSPELQNVMASPAIPASRKRAVAAGLADRLGLSRTTRNFLFVLIGHRRMEGLREIVDRFELELDAKLGFLRAEVSSPAPLDQSQQAALTRRLADATGKQVRVKYAVDESLIGGVVARIGSTVYDGSIRGQLRAMERRLTAR
jgi:F-type H+-transporting ATPase subunit delta